MTRAANGRFVGREFWEYVQKSDGCWLWSGHRLPSGYGACWFQGKHQRAHRVSFFLTHGYWPRCALHSCDQPACVNPDHLEDGNQKKNAADREERKRHGHRKRTLHAERVRDLLASGCRPTDIARWLDIPQPHVSMIKHRKMWVSV